MDKLRKWVLPVLLLTAIGFFLLPDNLPGWEAPPELPKIYQRQIQQELLQAAALLNDTPEDQASQEVALAQAGYSVIRTEDNPYPAFLEHPEALTAFWEALRAGENGCFSFFRPLEDGGLRHLFFLHENGETLFFTTDMVLGSGGPRVSDVSVLPVYDMELASWGIFYYRVYPANDPHYVDYAQLRLRPPDRALYDLNLAYILPVEYQMVNLFLCDWQEGDWGTLSFHDLLEPFYRLKTGQRFQWEQYGPPSQVRIPASVFEDTILPFFQISLEEFRRICRYDAATGSYPWRPILGDDLTTWGYPMCEPEVVACQENPDGTITLDVQVYSPELKTDRLFCHRVTVRPLEEGQFQYVSNTVTYVSDRGLPYSLPRFSLDG